MAEIPSIKFEAKKHGLRQNQDGLFKVSLTVHPNDMLTEFINAPMGQRFAVVLVAIDDDESPKDLAKPKRLFKDLPRSQQAGILCNDNKFINWASEKISFPAGAWPGVEQAIREYCKVDSRSDIDTNDYSSSIWDRLVSRYRQETGQEPEVRG